MDDRQEWLLHPQTKAFKDDLQSKIDAYKDGFEKGSTLVLDNPYTTHALTAGIKGKIEELNELIDDLVIEE